MLNVRSRRGDAGGYGGDLWPAFTLAWRRRPYRILAHAQGREGERWLARLPERRAPFFEPQPSTPWAYVGRETPIRGSAIYGHESGRPVSAAETINVYRLDWPDGGIFVPADGGAGSDYDPLAVAGEILLDVQRTAAAEMPASALGFVNRWGLLGIGILGADDFPTDGVERTGEQLCELAEWIAAIHALQHGRPGTRSWSDVASLFQQRLAGVHVQAQAAGRGLLPAFHVPRLIEGLYLELWTVATGGKRLRRCKRCEDFFIRGREDQIFCTGRCARLWHVKRWKQQQRRKRHSARQARHEGG